MSKRSTVTPEPVEKYPYVEITHLSSTEWRAQMITSDSPTYYEYYHEYDHYVKFAKTQKAAERKGKRMLDKWHRKYDYLADPYRIR